MFVNSSEACVCVCVKIRRIPITLVINLILHDSVESESIFFTPTRLCFSLCLKYLHDNKVCILFLCVHDYFARFLQSFIIFKKLTKNYFLKSYNIFTILKLVCISCIHTQRKLKLNAKLLLLTVINVARLLLLRK